MEHTLIPECLKKWRQMSNQQLEKAFDETPKEFQSLVYRFLCRTETNLQWFLRKIEETGDYPYEATRL